VAGRDTGAMPCVRCGRLQSDPIKGAEPWARAVVGGRQVLICPACQARDPSWTETLDRCPACGATRLSVVLGSTVCRACGRDWVAGDEDP
jgi:predicted amidophosphoribosyltransferase